MNYEMQAKFDLSVTWSSDSGGKDGEINGDSNCASHEDITYVNNGDGSDCGPGCHFVSEKIKTLLDQSQLSCSGVIGRNP